MLINDPLKSCNFYKTILCVKKRLEWWEECEVLFEEENNFLFLKNQEKGHPFWRGPSPLGSVYMNFSHENTSRFIFNACCILTQTIWTQSLQFSQTATRWWPLEEITLPTRTDITQDRTIRAKTNSFINAVDSCAARYLHKLQPRITRTYIIVDARPSGEDDESPGSLPSLLCFSTARLDYI